MKLQFESQEELTQYIADNVINTTEALAILGCSRQNIDSLVKRGKLKVIRDMPKDKIFWKADIMDRVKK